MTAKVIHTDDGIDILMSDGGVATIHHNGDNFVTTCYQDRIDKVEDYYNEVDIWEQLAEGKAYCGDIDPSIEEITPEIIAELIAWLGGVEDEKKDITIVPHKK